MNTARSRLTKLSAAVLVLAGALPVAAAQGAEPGVAARTLRIGMPLVADSLDPARVGTIAGALPMAGLYDTLYRADPFARPHSIVPAAAAALPEVSADYRTFTIRIRPGIEFTPHPAFGGRKRELVAEDFAYALKRVYDPALRSEWRSLIEGKIEGLDALARASAESGRPFDYDAPLPGIVVVDRLTLRIRLTAPDPIFPWVLTSYAFCGVAREVIEAERDAYSARPAGTGAFVVAEFTPGQRLVLARNPAYRARSGADLLAPASQRLPAAGELRAMRLPGTDRIEVTATPEAAAEVLALRRGELDLALLTVPPIATRDGKLLPELAREGIRLVRDDVPYSLFVFFNMRDPVVGGMAPERIALRRAMAMAFDDDEYIRVLDAGYSRRREQAVPPGIEGFVAGYRNPNAFDPAAANALLDRFGYRRGGDGHRRNPDGSELVVPVLLGTSSDAREYAQFTLRMYDRIGLRASFEHAPPADRVKRMTQCRYAVSGMDWGLDIPDGVNVMSMFWSKGIGSSNLSCFEDKVFDAAYEQALAMPPGAARTALFRTMQSRIDALAVVRPRPVGELAVLVRDRVVGPFGSAIDWLNVVALGVRAAPPASR